MKKGTMIYSTLAIVFGVFMFIYGGIDDSPGGQLLGLLVAIIGIISIGKRKKLPRQNKILAILFDYGDVIELSEIKVISGIVDILGVTKEEWRAAYYTYNHLTNVENRDWKEVALLVAEKLGATKEQKKKISDLADEGKKRKKLNTELLEWIRKLRSIGLKTGIISNYTSILRERIKEQNIADLFDTIVISAEEGHQKPSPELFEIAFKKLGVTSSNTIFVDDAPTSLRLAKEIGYTPILYTNNEDFRDSLTKILKIEL